MEITFEWVSINVEPDYDEPILVKTKNGKLMTFKDTKTFYGGDLSNVCSDWSFLIYKYNITHWVYQRYLL